MSKPRSYVDSVFGQAACARASALASIDDLGDRPYTVTVTVLRWTGGARGRGESVVDQEVKLSPTPKLVALGQLRQTMQAAGHVRTGTIVATGINPGHSRENLLGIDADGRPLSSEYEIIWEIEYWPSSPGDKPRKRRFHLTGEPERDGVKGWRVALIPGEPGPDRAGGYR